MEKGGLVQGLSQAGLKGAHLVCHSDEMRLGLRGQVRRVWGIRGIKVRQRVECTYQWSYLALAVDPLGALYWRWLPNLKKEQVAQVVGEWRGAGIEGLVWDNAPGHKARVVREVGVKLVPLPPYAPELNPAERIFEELRRSVEGYCYGSLEAKQARVEQELVALAADPGRVQQLGGWSWVCDALAQLPL
jgi:hypothetical protein